MQFRSMNRRDFLQTTAFAALSAVFAGSARLFLDEPGEWFIYFIYFSKNQLLALLILAMVSFVSFAFISALIL